MTNEEFNKINRGISNLLMLVGLFILSIAGIWWVLNQGWSPWTVTAACGVVVLAWASFFASLPKH